MPQHQNAELTASQLNSGGGRLVLLGIHGTGMRSLARILAEAGHQLVGTDSAICGSRQQTLQLTAAAERQTQCGLSSGRSGTDLVLRPVPVCAEDALWQHGTFDLGIRSPAVAADSAVVRKLQAAGTRCLTLHTALQTVFSNRREICVAGTHGKSTTSAMLSWILQHAGQQPGFFIGAQFSGLETGGRLGTGPIAVIESCEFNRSFCQLTPHDILLTGIDRDHFDCFPDTISEDEAFQAFLQSLPADGSLLYPADCLRSAALAQKLDRRVTSFGLQQTRSGIRGDWIAKDCARITAVPPGTSLHSSSGADHLSLFSKPQRPEFGTRFRCLHSDTEFAVLETGLLGRHNVLNVLAAVAMAAELGISATACRQAVATFPGIRRRFELRGLWRGMTLIDDYAHHPRAIQATLQAARQAFPTRRVVAVCEPHQVSRLLRLFPDFAKALQAADEVLLLPVFPAREKVTAAECRRHSGQLMRTINRQGGKAFLLADLDQVISRIDHSGRPGDVILTMGAGRTNQIHDEFNRRLQRNPAA